MKESICVPTGIKIEDTFFGYTLSILSGKYKMIILYWLFEHKVMRFNELQRCIGNIPHKTLSLVLKELESDNLIERIEYPQVPPKVEYKLTEKGLSLKPLLDEMCIWGAHNKNK